VEEGGRIVLLPEQLLMPPSRVVLGLSVIGLACVACKQDDRTVIESSKALAPQMDPSNDGEQGVSNDEDPAPARATFPADWCARLGSNLLEQVDAISEISDGYYFQQEEDCRTAGLTRGLTQDQLDQWLSYLFDYTNAMTGCPLLYEPIPGGILAFGPANTSILGVARQPLGRDDAEAVLRMYLGLFSDVLVLTPEERGAVEQHLWRTAESEIGSSASMSLSTCPTLGAGA
jgi:hypothetical protein